MGQRDTPVTFVLHNRGRAAATDPGLHPRDAGPWLGSDVVRLSMSVEGEGAPGRAVVTLTATSEGDPSASASAVRTVGG